MNLQIFNQIEFIQAIKSFFKDLNVPMNSVSDEPTRAKDILQDFYKDTDTFKLINDVYFAGMIDDAAFAENHSLDPNKIKSDYDGILVFGITLKERPNELLPTRSQLAEISRAFNRAFYFTPVVVIFKYGNYLAFANTERLKYKQEWREGEKAGKVSLLRDIKIDEPHSGHERILKELKIPTSGTKKVDSFSKLYTYWQEVFSVSLLNKKFYQELSNWYFWATKHVIYPGEPTIEDAHRKNVKLEDLLQEHRATNVIRMLTRLLFVWFIKEKKLIPEELFELEDLQKDILKDIAPYHDNGLFKERNAESVYYKAILQNLFFATLNCPIEGDSLDKRKRGFRGDGYGTHRGIDYLMRYKQYFKNPDAFLEKLNAVVPFLNGGLFECLDDKFNNIYTDGFSDQMIKGEQLVVPDYLFFGIEEEADLSDVVGIKDKRYKQAAVKGLINILKSYKFTITENTPIEEDVALDPELLGKVFENLLASYNPETKTTARKQTGSFYTPREVVNYMVDESLIAYLKNAIKDWKSLDDEILDKELHVLTSFDSKVPFADNLELQREIITKLSTCTILDPACGSGAFPMGILQKMVHILQKFDPDNEIWKEVQLEKAKKESEAAFEIEDKQAREERLIEINEAFDQSINDPDYARKLFLIENCIYGVDIQPIATQISKLRFFISLVVEQKVSPNKDNFGIRPLPNLETKFVAANTLIGIEKPKEGDQLKIGNDNQKIDSLKKELSIVRHKLFSARTKETKLKYRNKDAELRTAIAHELKDNFGWSNDAAEKLAKWDPYNQNASSPFFDPEWMFDIKEGFDVVIGNPPYINANELKKRLGKNEYELLKSGFESAKGTIDIYILFFEFGLKNLSRIGHLIYISPNRYLSASYGEALRELIYNHFSMICISDFSNVRVFEAASTYPIVSLIGSSKNDIPIKVREFNSEFEINDEWENQFSDLNLLPNKIWGFLLNSKIEIVKKIISQSHSLSVSGTINATSTAKEADEFHDSINDRNGLKLINTGTIDRFLSLWGINLLTDKGATFIEPYLDMNSIKVSPARKKLYENQKIIFAKIGLRAEAFFDQNGEFASVNTNCIHSFKSGYNPKYITLWVNSLLFQFIFSCFFDGLKMSGGYLLYSAPNLKSTFIKKPTLIETNVSINLYDFHVWILKNKMSITIDPIVDGFFFNLYFPDHMKERGVDLLEFLEWDINDVMQGREFEKLSEAEKEQVIEQLHSKWSHPDNEVNNRIKLFAVRSPEILKPILES